MKPEELESILVNALYFGGMFALCLAILLAVILR
jgi:hypothetical protein